MAKKESAQLALYLKLFFGIVPIVAGLDKFFNILVDWSMYVPDAFALPASILMAVGIVEIIAGAIVLWKTRIGGYIVAVWMVLVAINLVVAGFYDVAIRDLGLALAAYVMARMH